MPSSGIIYLPDQIDFNEIGLFFHLFNQSKGDNTYKYDGDVYVGQIPNTNDTIYFSSSFASNQYPIIAIPRTANNWKCTSILVNFLPQAFNLNQGKNNYNPGGENPYWDPTLSYGLPDSFPITDDTVANNVFDAIDAAYEQRKAELEASENSANELQVPAGSGMSKITPNMLVSLKPVIKKIIHPDFKDLVNKYMNIKDPKILRKILFHIIARLAHKFKVKGGASFDDTISSAGEKYGNNQTLSEGINLVTESDLGTMLAPLTQHLFDLPSEEFASAKISRDYKYVPFESSQQAIDVENNLAVNSDFDSATGMPLHEVKGQLTPM